MIPAMTTREAALAPEADPAELGFDAVRLPRIDRHFDRSVAEIKKAIPTAEKLSIEILIENVWNDFLTDPKTMAEFIDACGSKIVGAHLRAADLRVA